MLFNSLEFILFFPLVFILYWFVFNKNLKAQNIFLLIASYTFYGWWDWRFLILILSSSVVDYFIGLKIFNSDSISRRKIFLWISIGFNIGILVFFKYFNFFIDSFKDVLGFFDIAINTSTLNIILPVGISFYTFQTLSYTIDIFKEV